MPRRPSVDVMERDAQAADLYRRGLTYRQIAAQLGFRSPQSVGDAIRRHARLAVGGALGGPEFTQIMLDRLQDYRRAAWRVATARHYVTSQSGKLSMGPDGSPLLDDDPVLRALDRLLRFDQEESRLRDLYPAAKSRVEVITEDAVDAEMAEIARQIALNDARQARPADTGAA
jgi:hypothetical protein